MIIMMETSYIDWEKKVVGSTEDVIGDGREELDRLTKVYGTQALTHPSTNRTRRCLTSMNRCFQRGMAVDDCMQWNH